MKPRVALFLLVLLSAWSAGESSAAAQTLYTCGEGTVRRVETVVQIAEARPGAGAVPALWPPQQALAESVHDKRTEYLVTVRLGRVDYTARSSADVTWNFDPRGLAMNERIHVCANDARVVLDRLDGSDFRATVVRTVTSARDDD
jgi:hypothetical protein